ncbi:conjugal transfer ATP-binding protein TraC [Mesomycoplasma conjunctivae]|uniref:Mbov_0397 family ICE element conjugal transfer ATPase n=1 Tax=Mesomycoplasma conjunctivae TaxID=45361 RepID=UPI0002E53497|nr:DUF87 domain-containing protein [Mesomycoplasma conjunctivae]VEU65958.1 conjugal transfer ATP-binding protein TraC [Mesomycoplasma conjunctivae]
MKLQNKRIKSVQIHIFRNITLLDLPIILFLFFVSVSIGFTVNDNLFILWKILISFTLFMTTSFPLVKYYKSWALKGYKIVWYFLLYQSRPKRHIRNSKTSANTVNLVPYIKAKNKTIQISGGFFAGVEIKGQDIFSIGSEKIEQIMHKLTIALNAINSKITIVKIAQENDLSKNMIFFEQNKHLCQQKFDQDFCANYQEDIKNFGSYLHHKYFIIIYEKSNNSLLQQLNLLHSNLINSGFANNILNSEELLNVHLKIINFSDFLTDEEINYIHQGDNIAKYVAQKEIKWKPEYFQINDLYFSIQSINEYPFQLPLGWASQLFSSNSNVIWHLTRLTSQQKESSFSKGARNLESNMNEKFNIVQKSKSKIERMALEQIIDVAGSAKEEIFYSTFLFLSVSNTIKGLKELEIENKNNLKNIGATINHLKYRQLQAFTQISFRYKNLLEEDIEMPASNISFGIPFTNRNFNDENFNIIGTTKNEYSPIFFDIFLQNQDRKNSNAFILGTSGAGKTTMTKKIILYNQMIDNITIVLDPQNEYWKLAQFSKGQIINFGGDNTTLFNPLQIQKVFNPKFKEISKYHFNNYETIALHLNTLERFFTILFPNLSHKMIIAIVDSVQKIYKKEGFYLKEVDITKLNSHDYPTISDLIREVKESDFDYLLPQEKATILASLNYEFGDLGKLNHLFNGVASEINLQNLLTIFNVSTLMHLEKRIYQAGFFLILSFIEGQIAANIQNDKKIILVVDEAHKFIDESNMIALDFLFKITKTIRKYNGSIVITTQNPGDFAISGEFARKSESIIENCQYAFFFNLKNNDIEKVDKLFSASGGLTNEEKYFISYAQVGDFIFFVNANERYLCSSYYNSGEKHLFFDQGNRFLKITNDYEVQNYSN